MDLPGQQHAPSLGGGKKETEFRGKARTQVLLMPRALRQQAAPKPQTANTGDSNQQLRTRKNLQH
uniref:Uncharacterized protein n=3 Tax=Arion vulgaris TaxID=1028688 RepID=A0A0B7B6P6_9EUPU